MTDKEYPPFDATETIDLEKLGLSELSETGSFIVSEVEKTSFGKLVYGIPMPVLVLGMPEPYIHMMNGAGSKFIGYSPQLKGRSLFELFSREEVGLVQRAISKLYSTRKNQQIETNYPKRKQGVPGEGQKLQPGGVVTLRVAQVRPGKRQFPERAKILQPD